MTWHTQPGPMSADMTMEHLDGVPWHEAPAPRKSHVCTAQTRGWLGFDEIERCACGAIRRNGRSWLDRNSRTDDKHWREGEPFTEYASRFSLARLHGYITLVVVSVVVVALLFVALQVVGR